MSFSENIRSFVRERKSALEHIKSEDQTKLALVFPFIRLLGYDTTNPSEVVPEYTADVGVKKGEKVDVAIFKDGRPVMLMECKCLGDPLVDHNTQLYRYFSVTSAKFSVLTDGSVYQFYSDIEEQNRMDERPFFVFNLFSATESEIDRLSQFQKHTLDVDELVGEAEKLKYTRETKERFAKEVRSPSDDFVKHLSMGIYPGRFTERALGYCREISVDAINEYMREYVNRHLQQAMDQIEAESASSAEVDVGHQTEIEGGEEHSAVNDSSEEQEAFLIVKAIARQLVSVDRLSLREGRSYCSILVDDNIRRGICKIRFGVRKKTIELPFDNPKRIEITTVDEIYDYSDDILKMVAQVVQ